MTAINTRKRCWTESAQALHNKTTARVVWGCSLPVLLLLGVGKGCQHVRQRSERKVQAVHMVLTEHRHPNLRVACDSALGGLQLP